MYFKYEILVSCQERFQFKEVLKELMSKVVLFFPSLTSFETCSNRIRLFQLQEAFSKAQHPSHLVKNPGTRNPFHPTQQQAAVHNYFHLVITQGGEFNL